MIQKSKKKKRPLRLRVMRAREVQATVGVSRSTLMTWVKNEQFPAPMQLGKNSIGWLASEVEDWIALRALEAKDKQYNYDDIDDMEEMLCEN